MLANMRVWDKEHCGYCNTELEDQECRLFMRQCFIDCDKEEVVGYHLCYDCFWFETNKSINVFTADQIRKFIQLRFNFFSSIYSIAVFTSDYPQ